MFSDDSPHPHRVRLRLFLDQVMVDSYVIAVPLRY